MSSRPGPRFRHGERFTRDFTFPEGTIRLFGHVGVDREGKLLLLWDVDIRPLDRDRLAVGLVNVRRIIAMLCVEAAADGFDTLVVNGYRLGGAHPSRFIEVEFECRSSHLGPRPVAENSPDR